MTRREGTIRDMLAKRLFQGPATQEELAVVAWGNAERPMFWPNALACHITLIKNELSPDGLTVRCTSLYEITSEVGS